MADKRIAKFISDSGYCSRRDAEKLILSSRVMVNGNLINTPAINISESSEVFIDGKPITKKDKPRIWLYHKMTGFITTHKDPQNRPTVFDNLPKNLPRVISVGRLDLNSEGLLLLTNSGNIARHLELPSNRFLRIYKVRAHGMFDISNIATTAKRGVTIDEESYSIDDIKLIKSGKNSWFEVHLREGKNREIRKIFEHFGLKVSRLIRISYGPFALADLKPGKVKEVEEKEVIKIMGELIK